MSALKHLFSPITIRSMTLANRAVMPPMGTSLARDSMVTEANLAYMRRQASSGVGLVITEIAAVHPTGCYGSDQIAVYDDRFMPGLEKLARVVHEAGGKVALQLHHTGRGARVTVIEKLDQSPVPKITSHGYMLHRRLKEKGCALLLGTSLAEIRSESVVVVKGGEEQVLTPTDQVIMAVGMKPCDDLSRALDTGGIPYRVVGDAVAVRRIIEATEEGARAIWDLG